VRTILLRCRRGELDRASEHETPIGGMALRYRNRLKPNRSRFERVWLRMEAGNTCACIFAVVLLLVWPDSVLTDVGSLDRDRSLHLAVHCNAAGANFSKSRLIGNSRA
jgi:hypothetical protein